MIYLRTSIGIEIRREDLLISALQGNFAAGVFTHFKRIASYRTREREEVRREIDTFFRSRRLNRDNIVLGLPRRDIIVRHLDLPKEVADNLKQVVQYQVQSLEPTEEDKYFYDHAPLKLHSDGKRLYILVVMIRKSLLDEHLAILRDLGIKPSAVTCASVALANLLVQARPDAATKTFIIADVTPGGMEITALREASLAYTRQVPKEDGGNWRDLLVAELVALTAKIGMDPEDAIESIVLAGEESVNVQQELQEELADCELMESHIGFEMTVQNRSHLLEAAVSLGLAYTGLAHRPALRLNLLPAHLRIRQTRWAYVPAAILGLAIIALLCGLGFRQMIQERSLIKRLDAEIQSIASDVDRVKAVRGEADVLERKIKFFEELLRRRDMNLEVLQEMTGILPADTFLNQYTNRDGAIQVSGASSSVPDLIPMLERSPLLKEVVQRGTVFKDAQSGKDRFQFEAKVER